jgi:hypothetical protein
MKIIYLLKRLQDGAVIACPTEAKAIEYRNACPSGYINGEYVHYTYTIDPIWFITE